MVRVLSTYPLKEAALERLRAFGAEVVDVSGKNATRERLLAEIADADGLIHSLVAPKIDAEMLDKAKRLRVVVSFAVGYDNIDVHRCAELGIPVGHGRNVIADAVADLAIWLITSTLRRTVTNLAFARSGEWRKHEHGNDLARKTLGIFGMGAIGSAVAVRAIAAKMEIIYHNRSPRTDLTFEARYVSFDELLAQSDVLIVTAALTSRTRGIFGAEQFAKMKPGARFVNSSRGGLVDTEALYNALASGHLAYAGIDVTDPEPLPVDHPLWKLPNVVVTPHMGTSTPETRELMQELAVSNLIAGLQGKPLPAGLPMDEIS